MHHEEIQMRKALLSLRVSLTQTGMHSSLTISDDLEAKFRALMATVLTPTGERYRHEKRGTTYDVFGFGHANSSEEVLVLGLGSSRPEKVLFDRDEIVVYRDVQSGAISVRTVEEFGDGRFTLLPPRTGRPAVDAARTLSSALGQAPPPVAPPAAPARSTSSGKVVPEAVGMRVEFALSHHIMNGKRGTLLDYVGDGTARVKWDEQDEPGIVNTLNLKAVMKGSE